MYLPGQSQTIALSSAIRLEKARQVQQQTSTSVARGKLIPKAQYYTGIVQIVPRKQIAPLHVVITRKCSARQQRVKQTFQKVVE